jgi:hypothetical protein
LQMTRLLQTPPHLQVRHAQLPARPQAIGAAETPTPPFAGRHRLPPQSRIGRV